MRYSSELHSNYTSFVPPKITTLPTEGAKKMIVSITAYTFSF